MGRKSKLSQPSFVPAPRALSVLMVLFVTAVLTTARGGGSPGRSSAGAVPGGGAFPVTVQHVLGSTVVPARNGCSPSATPTRTRSSPWVPGDGTPAELAEPAGWVNRAPVAIRQFTGNQPSATWPWARDRLQGQQPEVLRGELNTETIAALQPDLIVAVSAGLTPEQYETYSKIAPTITQPEGSHPFQTAWQDSARLIGAVLGVLPGQVGDAAGGWAADCGVVAVMVVVV